MSEPLVGLLLLLFLLFLLFCYAVRESRSPAPRPGASPMGKRHLLLLFLLFCYQSLSYLTVDGLVTRWYVPGLIETGTAA